MKTVTKLWIGIGVLAVLSPLGIILPEHFHSGAAWGEWGADELGKMVGYVPRGLEKLSGSWRAPLSGYAFDGGNNSALHPGFAYIVSAIVGIALVAALILLLGRIMVKEDDEKKK